MMMACGVGDEDDGDGGDNGDCGGDGDCDDGAHRVPGSLLKDHIVQSSKQPYDTGPTFIPFYRCLR